MAADARESRNGEERAPSQRPLLGKVVDLRYRVLAHIGSGGMADVYEVEHVTLGRRLAMKVLRETNAGNPRLARRFSREARAASQLISEHVVSIHDYGVLPEGNPYFVMALLRGQNLRELLEREQRLPVGRAVNIAIDVCLGLHAAHAAGLVHRDLKPENLWLSRGDDGRELCVLLDFGVARFDGAHTTGDGVLVGTARYMSPEQIGSEKPPGPASDLFSLGLLLYECLTGALPFVADTLERTLFRILNDKAPLAGEVNPDVPVALSEAIDKLLSKAPERRFTSALELAAALRPFAGARSLPQVSGAGPGVSEDTVIEARSEPSPTPPATVSPTTLARQRPMWLGFAAGLLLATALLLVLRAAFAPVAAPVSAARLPAPLQSLTPAATAPASEPSPEPAAAAQPAEEPPSASPKPLRRQTPPVAPLKSARQEPPKLDFDGRNPYLQ